LILYEVRLRPSPHWNRDPSFAARFMLTLAPMVGLPGIVVHYETLVSILGFDLADVWAANIAKLRARHGEAYNQGHYDGGKP
jgi:hypothetical protein